MGKGKPGGFAGGESPCPERPSRALQRTGLGNGNELWNRDDNGWQTPAGNAVRYREFFNAIRSLLKPGSMVLVTGGDIDFFHNWNAQLIPEDTNELHFLTTHFVVGTDSVVNKMAGRNFVWKADFAVPVGVGRGLARVKGQIDSNPATRVPDISNVPRLDVLATRDSRRHDLSLFVVNRYWEQSFPAEIRLHGFPAAATAAVVHTLNSDSILTNNNQLHPDRIRPASSHISVPERLIHYNSPPHSLTVFIFARR